MPTASELAKQKGSNKSFYDEKGNPKGKWGLKKKRKYYLGEHLQKIEDVKTLAQLFRLRTYFIVFKDLKEDFTKRRINYCSQLIEYSIFCSPKKIAVYRKGAGNQISNPI